MFEVLDAFDTWTEAHGLALTIDYHQYSTLPDLAQPDTIYAFHTYAPFIFTHQGATWANMGSTHDLPYPYDPARWSGYYSDLGFNSAMESWILSAAQSDNQDGSRSALRNRILQAKRWAVAHEVPVICNEFGA